jgi:hypothetical protein
MMRSGASDCANCVYGRKIQSPRGSVFYLCERSVTEPDYPKYPRLPVVACSGYVLSTEQSRGAQDE